MRKILTYIILLCSIAVSGQNILERRRVASSTLPSSLIAYYKLENNTNDEEEAYNATLVGDPAYSTTKKAGSYSLYLDGTGDVIDHGNVDIGTEFTLCAWINIDDTDTYRHIWANRSTSGTVDGFSVRIRSNGEIMFLAGDGSDESLVYTSSGVFTFDQWNWLVVTYSRTDEEVHFYLNNTDVTPTSYSISDANTFSTDIKFVSGGLTGTYDSAIGYFDEIMLFDEVLSTTEITSIYNLY